MSSRKAPRYATTYVNKLEVNANHYFTQVARMALVWSFIISKANKHLKPRYKPGAKHRWRLTADGTMLERDIKFKDFKAAWVCIDVQSLALPVC